MEPTSPALFVLADGSSWLGRSFGAEGESIGRAVIVTEMTGYQEMLTDTARSGQIVVATATHIGNTGWNDEDSSSDRIQVAGYVVRDPSPRPSSWRSSRSLEDAMRAEGIVGIRDIDTRALTRHLSDQGSMGAAISTVDTDVASLVKKIQAWALEEGKHHG
jgi:carbamoyl-phosphate synthase small subunit